MSGGWESEEPVVKGGIIGCVCEHVGVFDMGEWCYVAKLFEWGIVGCVVGEWGRLEVSLQYDRFMWVFFIEKNN